jgi:hypothetical protein
VEQARRTAEAAARRRAKESRKAQAKAERTERKLLKV